MMVPINKISRTGLDNKILERYLLTLKCQLLIQSIKRGDILPPINVYPEKNDLYTIADGIHRFSAYTFLGINQIEIKLI